MGKREEESRVRTRRANLKKLVLQTVAIAGVLGVAVVAPNVLSAMVKLGIVPLKRQREFVNASRARLVRQGLLVYEGRNIKLTSAGERALRALQLEEYALKKPRRWDGKWRVLIFDIPEYRKGLRDKIRRTLEMIGFVRLQDSVWVYPYDCEDLITLLKADFRVGKDVLYLIVDSIENDKYLRAEFNLT